VFHNLAVPVLHLFIWIVKLLALYVDELNDDDDDDKLYSILTCRDVVNFFVSFRFLWTCCTTCCGLAIGIGFGVELLCSWLYSVLQPTTNIRATNRRKWSLGGIRPVESDGDEREDAGGHRARRDELRELAVNTTERPVVVQQEDEVEHGVEDGD